MSLDYEHASVTVADERAVVVGATGGIERAIAIGLAEGGRHRGGALSLRGPGPPDRLGAPRPWIGDDRGDP